MAVEPNSDIASLLKKRKILAFRLGNEEFKTWIDNELNGYKSANELPEYHSRLTVNLVTGKLDVREAAAKLPVPPTDTAAEPAPDKPLEELEDEPEETNDANN